jgi:hypothetical protein
MKAGKREQRKCSLFQVLLKTWDNLWEGKEGSLQITNNQRVGRDLDGPNRWGYVD